MLEYIISLPLTTLAYCGTGVTVALFCLLQAAMDK